MDVRKLTDITDTLVIVSGTSSRHVKSLADNASLELKKAGHRAYNIEGDDAGEWVLVDFGDAVLHVMQPQIREFYDLEKLWGTPTADSDPANNSPATKKNSLKKPIDNNKE
jgi:ribosome-associated protein